MAAAEPQVQAPAKPKVKKRTIDKWKKKIWYTIFDSPEFDKKELMETLASKPEHLLNRVLVVSARELLNDAKRMFIDVHFKVIDVQGSKASTSLNGFEVRSSSVRKQTRRNASKIESVQTVETKDKQKIKVKCITITLQKVHVPKETDIRKVMVSVIAKEAQDKDFEAFAQEALSNDLVEKIFESCKKIAMIKKIEITKFMKE